jgi:hypothetical protein
LDISRSAPVVTGAIVAWAAAWTTPSSEAPKTSPAEGAAGILEGLAADHKDIFPDPNWQAMSHLWSSDRKSFERTFADMAAT